MKYEFKLAPGYCLSKGIAVLEQDGAYIKYMLNNLDDEVLKEKLRKAFCTYLNYVKEQDDCPMKFRKIPHIEFIGGNKNFYEKIIAKDYCLKESRKKYLGLEVLSITPGCVEKEHRYVKRHPVFIPYEKKNRLQ